MSAHPEENSQRDDLQCDNSSSSSGSESPKHESAPKELFLTLPELNIYDDKKFDEQATTSSAIAVPSSSDLDVRNEENLEVLQSPGFQNQTSNHVEITGGEFVGAHFGSQTTYQNIYLKKLEQSHQFHVHHHYHAEQGTSSKEPVGATGYKPDQQQAVTEEPITNSEEVELCRFIKLFPQCRISENICHGEQISELTGIRPLAIKFIHYKKEKLQEAKILTKLHPHHNVVSIVHSDVYQQHAFKYIYIAMELCHKQDLHDHVTENKNNKVPFDPQLSISQAKQLVEGFHFIHENDIIHRDLKPHNVLFSIDKKTLKIADFGISKEMTSGRTMTYVTNARAGTDGYRAPETYNSNKISKQADIFSLGLVFYFLWSNGHHAFGDDPDDWNSNIKKNKMRDLSQLLLPDKELAIDLLEWMLRVNPRERPTVSQILRHQLFGGKEKDPMSTRRETAPQAEQGTSSKEPVGATGYKPDQQQQQAVTEEPGTNSEGRRPSRSKRGRRPEKMKLLKEKSQQHLMNEEYSSASEVLQELLENQTDPRSQRETIQQIAECHVMCDVPIHEDVEKFISICESFRRPFHIIEDLANDHFKHSRLVRAYFLYICASKWSKTHNSPSKAVKVIERCIKKVRDFVEKEKQVGILSNHVQSNINEMLEDQASCSLGLGRCYNKVGDYVKARNYLWQGHDQMRNYFKGDVVKHKLYGHIWKNLGISEAKMGDRSSAKECYQLAIKVFKKAEDYKEEDEKRNDIESTEQALSRISRR